MADSRRIVVRRGMPPATAPVAPEAKISRDAVIPLIQGGALTAAAAVAAGRDMARVGVSASDMLSAMRQGSSMLTPDRLFIVPGWVRSVSDLQWHYISVDNLRSLYDVRWSTVCVAMAAYTPWSTFCAGWQEHTDAGFIPLVPKEDGAYRLSVARTRRYSAEEVRDIWRKMNPALHAR